MAERMVSQAPIRPGAGAEGDLYAVPAGYQGVSASIIICNTSSTVSDTFRVRKAKGGAVTATSQSLAENQGIGPGETVILSFALTLDGGDIIRVMSTGGTCNFDYNGTEVA